jgi:hypothetical protein
MLANGNDQAVLRVGLEAVLGEGQAIGVGARPVST